MDTELGTEANETGCNDSCTDATSTRWFCLKWSDDRIISWFIGGFLRCWNEVMTFCQAGCHWDDFQHLNFQLPRLVERFLWLTTEHSGDWKQWPQFPFVVYKRKWPCDIFSSLSGCHKQMTVVYLTIIGDGRHWWAEDWPQWEITTFTPTNPSWLRITYSSDGDRIISNDW